MELTCDKLDFSSLSDILDARIHLIVRFHEQKRNVISHVNQIIIFLQLN